MKPPKSSIVSRNSHKPENGKEKWTVANYLILLTGVALLAAAFVILAKADSMGSNAAAKTAPFVFLAAWGMIIYGILYDNGPSR